MKWYPLAEIRLTGKLTDTHCFLLCSPFIIFILRACVSRATRMMDLDLQDHKWDMLKKEVEDAIYEMELALISDTDSAPILDKYHVILY